MLRRPRSARRPNDQGASAIEYGLMVAAIAAVVVGVVIGLSSIVQAAVR
ncbi:MAG: Flp family type IVb pilin [Kineosporiaceae bacterium]|nr:Flp family type IVb pilin [Kineosporiaceae bacterium]MBK7624526.1 Flp family type IVb pilin [Kineosporiaceae bacterium]MBK8077103.1 Flp family type IVb pilin [Kineosporiaceae bacterium]